MTSEVSICNLAIDHCGGRRITSLSDDTTAGRLCSANYATQREMCIGEGKWAFARKRVELAALVAAPAFGYTYQFQLPSDYVSLVQFNDNEDGQLEYTIEGDRVLCDETSIKLIYVHNITDPGKFPAMFIDALALRLASVIAYKLTGSRTKADELRANYREIISRALSLDSQQNDDQKVQHSNWLQARHGFTSGYYSDEYTRL